MFGQRCLDGLIFGFGLISSLFIQKDVIFWWVSSKNEKTSRDKMIAMTNLKGVKSYFSLESNFGGYLGKLLICLGLGD